MTGAAGSAQQLTLMLDWFPNADHVGIYQALAEGDFAKADLDVHIQVPSDPATPLKLLAAGKVDAAISYEPEVLLARDQGLPLVSVAAIVQGPLTSIVSIGSKHITTPAQLRGKRVGDAGIPYQHAYLGTILARAGVPGSSVKEINVGANLVPAMLSGRVDATLGAYWNYEAIQLAQLHKHPNVIHMEDVGVPDLRRARRRRSQEHDRQPPGCGQAFRAGAGAGLRVGTPRSPGGRHQPGTGEPGLDPKLQLASVRATLSRSSRATRRSVGVAGPQSVERLRAVDAEPPPDLGSERSARRLDQRAARRPGPVARQRARPGSGVPGYR